MSTTASYPSLKPLPKNVPVEPKEMGYKGMVRKSVYERQQFQRRFKKDAP